MSFPVMGIAPFSQLCAAPTAVKHATVGTLAMDPLGGLWRYCYAGGTLIDMLGAGNYNQPIDVTPTATSAGSWTLAFTGGTPTRTAVVNDLADGSIVIGGASSGYRKTYYIKSNTLGTTSTSTLTLHNPLTTDIAGTEWATINRNPYSDVRALSTASWYMSVVCMPLQGVTSTYYFWGKTKGVVTGIAVGNAIGSGTRERTLVFYSDGSIRPASECWATSGMSDQYAGYLIPRTMGTYASGDSTFMLDLE